MSLDLREVRQEFRSLLYDHESDDLERDRCRRVLALLDLVERGRGLLEEIAAEGSTILGHVETATQAPQDGLDDWLAEVRAFLRDTAPAKEET